MPFKQGIIKINHQSLCPECIYKFANQVTLYRCAGRLTVDTLQIKNAKTVVMLHRHYSIFQTYCLYHLRLFCWIIHVRVKHIKLFLLLFGCHPFIALQPINTGSHRENSPMNKHPRTSVTQHCIVCSYESSILFIN